MGGNFPAIAAGVSALLSAAITVLFSVGWINRRHAGKLMDAQATYELAQASHERADALSTVVEGATVGLIVAMQRQLDEERKARAQERAAYTAWLDEVSKSGRRPDPPAIIVDPPPERGGE